MVDDEELLPRPPDEVVGRERAAAATPTALSLTRAAMRSLVRGRWRIVKDRVDLDGEGRGEVLYRLEGAGRRFHFFLVSDKLPEEVKTDRNFAASWDAMGVLCEGEWTAAREARLRREVPRQRAGWADYDTLMYARGNRSTRLFEHVVDCLADGRQPDPRVIAPVGYVLRTTAFIGNGQLGTRPLAAFGDDHPLRPPYHAQFVSAFVLREYVFDLVDHMARARSPRAVRLSYAHRRYLGLGNSAATGLVHYVANHPRQLQRWCAVHEAALADVVSRTVSPGDPRPARLAELLDRAVACHDEVAHATDGVFAPPQRIAADLRMLRGALDGLLAHAGVRPWPALRAWARPRLSRDAREVLDAILLELHPEVASGHDGVFEADERIALDPSMTAGELARIVERDYGWACAPGFADASTHFWYRTTHAPRDIRRARRGLAAQYESETTLDTPLRVSALREALAGVAPDVMLADLLFSRPDLRMVAMRVQALAGQPYAELRMNPLAADFDPFEPTRLMLALFGLEKFEAAPPKSVRGTFLQGAPIAEDVVAGVEGTWPFPLMPGCDDAGDGPPPLGAAHATRARPAPPHPRAADAPDGPEERRIAPDELARMIRVALQGHGATLGEADTTASIVVLGEQLYGDAVEAVLDACATGRIAAARGRRLRARAPGFAAIDGNGAAALAMLPSALDAATADALRTPAGIGVVQAAHVAHARHAATLVLACARRGHAALIAWSDPQDEPPAGFAAALPASGRTGDADAPACALGTLAAAPRLQRAAADASDRESILAVLGEGVAAALAPADHAPAPGFVLLCGRPGTAVADAAAAVVLDATVPATTCWDAEALSARLRERLMGGVPLPRAMFERLETAGRSLLLPSEHEPSVLPPGTDPVKVF